MDESAACHLIRFAFSFAPLVTMRRLELEVRLAAVAPIVQLGLLQH